MRASWSALHASLSTTLNRTSSETAFTAMRRASPELRRFQSIASLMEHQHSPSSDTATRFGVIRALVAAAQSDCPYRSTAQIMVIVALWPGLDAVFWRLWRGFPGAREDLSGEIISRISDAILTINLERVAAVTATLLLNLERDIRRDLIRARLLAADAQHIDDPAAEVQTAMLEGRATVETRSIDDHLADLAPNEGRLLKRVFLLGETQEEAGRAMGMRPAAARKRFQRALAKLRARRKFPSQMSQSGPRVGL